MGVLRRRAHGRAGARGRAALHRPAPPVRRVRAAVRVGPHRGRRLGRGEDAQHRSIVPLTEDEAETLETESLVALGRGRRYLVTDWPTEAPGPTIGWSTGELRLPESRLR